MLTDEQLRAAIDTPTFHLIGEEADALGVEAYVIGGYVRDLLLGRASKDIDIVAVGRGIDLARAVAARLGRDSQLSVYARFGTALVKRGDLEVEFVGARRESYSPDSRKPMVEDGTLEEDQRRRDFTINALALCLNKARFGELLDPFDGVWDLEDLLIRTPLDPEVTFSDDPLRMLRAVRFASQLGFTIEEETFDGIAKMAERIKIVSQERVADELNKVMRSPKPSIGLNYLDQTGLLELIMPEVYALRSAETRDGIGHKDNLAHTFIVVDNVAKKSDDLYLRWSALLHDIGKPKTKRYESKRGWSFHNHNYVGAKMVPVLFRRLRLPTDQKMRYVQKMVDLHMRPQTLVDEGVTDSAVRRLLFEASEDIDDLMLLCEADITSKNPTMVKRYLNNYTLVRKKLIDIEKKDSIRNFKPPVDGAEIMEIFGLSPSPVVGSIKTAIKDSILDGVIPNEREAALELMYKKASEFGLRPKKK